MNRPLRKSSSGIHIAYSDGSCSSNLMGSDFALEESAGVVTVKIDLSPNLRVRNKDENCYFDACELAKNHSKLTSVQIFDGQVIRRLASSYKRLPDARWKLELALGGKRIFQYPVRSKGNKHRVFLIVRSEA